MKKALALMLVLVFVLGIAACGNTAEPTPAPGGDTPAATNPPDAPAAPDAGNDPAPAPDAGDVAADPTGWQTAEGLINGLEGNITISAPYRHLNVSDPAVGGVYEYFSQYYPNFSALIPQDRPNEGDAYNAVTALINAGQTPDLIDFSSGDAPSLVMNNYLEPLDSLLAEYPEFSASLLDSAKTLNAVNGVTYGIVWQFLPRAWVLNLDLFERAGVEPPDNDWTVEEFVDIANRLNNKAEGYVAVQGEFHIICNQFLLAYDVVGEKLVDGKIRAAYHEDPNAVAALQMAYDLQYQDNDSQQFTAEEAESLSAPGESLWTLGHMAMAPFPPWGLPYDSTTDSYRFRYKVLAPPMGPTGMRNAGADAIALGIFPTSANKDLAFKFIMAMLSEHFTSNAVVVDGVNRIPAGFSADVKRMPTGFPGINMQHVTHPDNQEALEGYMLASESMTPSRYSVAGMLNNEIINHVVSGNMSMADMLEQYDNRRNGELADAGN